MHIVIVEDDAVIRQELKLLLENALYQVTALEDFSDVSSVVLSLETDLVLLDLNLPLESGFDICTKIRARSAVPVIFVTSRTDSMDELTGILKGGDDYITKPFQAPILLARIGAVLKRTQRQFEGEPARFVHKEVELDISRGTIGFHGNQRELSKNELKIMHLLFKRKGQIVPRADMIEYLWDNQVFIDDNTLSVNITRIRGKLAEIGIEHLIETRRGMGYRI
ncbi:MAG: response regulator transcription factor [Dorea sp.]|jgi:Response regulators consisting of a CheY-like receiver domain and a winged-helix DNA-binding domain|nr:response regulator transcription factor [Dorea sp.]